MKKEFKAKIKFTKMFIAVDKIDKGKRIWTQDFEAKKYEKLRNNLRNILSCSLSLRPGSRIIEIDMTKHKQQKHPSGEFEYCANCKYIILFN